MTGHESLIGKESGKKLSVGELELWPVMCATRSGESTCIWVLFIELVTPLKMSGPRGSAAPCFPEESK